MNRNILKLLVAILLLISLSGFTLNAQDAITRKEKRFEKRVLQFTQTDSLITTQTYKFDARKANPASGQQVDLTTHSADLIIRRDSAFAYLPFFGRAFVAGYGGVEGGIKFEELMKSYTLEKDTAKLNFQISFSIKTSIDSYDFTIMVSYSGSATISVTSHHRSFISYHGNIVPIKKD